MMHFKKLQKDHPRNWKAWLKIAIPRKEKHKHVLQQCLQTRGIVSALFHSDFKIIKIPSRVVCIFITFSLGRLRRDSYGKFQKQWQTLLCFCVLVLHTVTDTEGELQKHWNSQSFLLRDMKLQKLAQGSVLLFLIGLIAFLNNGWWQMVTESCLFVFCSDG